MPSRNRVLSAFAATLVVYVAAVPVAVALDAPREPSSGELVESPLVYDGAAVAFEGEAIGEAMIRGDHAWVHLNDDAYMKKNVEEGAPLGGYNSGMPVWLSARDAQKVGVFGDYQHAGDIVRVEGRFNAACAEHGGDMDIHGISLERIVPGRIAEDPIHAWKVILAGVLSFAAAGAWWAEGRAVRSERFGLSRPR